MTVAVEFFLKEILERLERKIDKLDSKIDLVNESVERKIENLNESVERKIENVERKIEKLSEDVNQKIDKLSEDVNQLKTDVKVLQTQVSGLDQRIGNQEFSNRAITVALASAFFISVLKLFFPNFPGSL
ncbi:MAG: hypothetical protein GDA44_06415 [Prochloron sp. SP5CPC1]|nr:hypothetical protein [Candidatus Paraprochloron terpiosi SP5CPC1]